MTDRSSTDLPHAIADRVTKPLARFLKIEAAAGGLLLLAVLVALLLANSPWSVQFLKLWETPIGLHFGSLDFSRSLRHWINDGLMTFFFFVISLELKREIVLGELRNLRTAALPFAAALGGMLVPVAVYLALMSGQQGTHGWAVTESLSPVERLETMLHPWVGFAVMPVFALANAGVAITVEDIGQPVSLAIFAGLALGKPVGVFCFSWLAVRFGLVDRASSLSWPFLAAGAFLTGIGFTMSLFIAGLAYAPAMLDAAKLGILAGSVFSAVAGLATLAWLTSRERAT